ncbi:SctD/MshK family protein [Bradyrhizobium oligotrophicum]|uniref:SctD/MshK family protein n=1 Tax=Bradyrhizobium oligotrophicum TaxID=44255 RepID=UPI003EB85C56
MTTHQSLLAEIDLHVRSGCHAGVIERLVPGVYTIGRSRQADIMLSDPALDEMAARVEVDAAALRVESLGGDVVLNTARIEPGTTDIARYPVDLVVDGICLRWALPPQRPGRRAAWAMAGISVLGIVGTAAAAMGLRQGEMPLGKLLAAGACEVACTAEPIRSAGHDARLVAAALHTDASADSRGASASLREPIPATAGISIQAAALALGQRLSAVGLSAIDVSTTSDAVIAKGFVDPSVVYAWYETREWFDQTFGTAVVLTSKVETRPIPQVATPLSVQSVWAGKTPYVIDQRGQKYFQGAQVNDGWSIERIEQGRITLRRSAQVFVLKL